MKLSSIAKDAIVPRKAAFNPYYLCPFATITVSAKARPSFSYYHPISWISVLPVGPCTAKYLPVSLCVRPSNDLIIVPIDSLGESGACHVNQRQYKTIFGLKRDIRLVHPYLLEHVYHLISSLIGRCRARWKGGRRSETYPGS
jgi:hypothetical protein